MMSTFVFWLRRPASSLVATFAISSYVGLTERTSLLISTSRVICWLMIGYRDTSRDRS